MVKVSVLPKETLAELLHFLADNERFDSVTKNLSGGMTAGEVRAALRELARELSAEAASEGSNTQATAGDMQLSPGAREVIMKLTSTEGDKLLSAFGLK